MAVRDMQRQRLYDAENLVARMLDRAAAGSGVIQVAGSTITAPPERRFGDVAGVQAYVDAVLALNWVRAAWPGRACVPVTVRARARAGRRKAHYESGGAVIAVPTHEHERAGRFSWAMRELVVLHELAHHLDPDPVGTVPHGPEFAGRLLTLAGEIIGPEVALLLRCTFAESGVQAGPQAAAA